MSSPQAFTTIKDHLTDVWNVTPLSFENEGSEPPVSEKPFVKVEVYGTMFAQASIGAEGTASGNLFRERGVLIMHVMIPVHTGTLTGRQLAWQLATMFTGRTIDGVVFEDSAVGAGDPAIGNGNFAPMTVSVDWHLDH